MRLDGRLYRAGGTGAICEEGIRIMANGNLSPKFVNPFPGLGERGGWMVLSRFPIPTCVGLPASLNFMRTPTAQDEIVQGIPVQGTMNRSAWSQRVGLVSPRREDDRDTPIQFSETICTPRQGQPTRL